VNVKPDEIANVCAIYAMLRTDRIARQTLESYVTRSLLIDSRATIEQIINECVTYKLLERAEKNFILTARGRELSKKQQGTQSQLRDSARDYLLRSVYLDARVMNASCRAFLLSFRVDVAQSTFVYDRASAAGVEVGQWLRVLYRLGFLEVNQRFATIRKEYLEVFNTFLARAREDLDTLLEIVTAETDEVGNFAEDRAVQYEIRRLSDLGQSDLALLVQRISGIDRSAGYDVISCRGTGRQPEQAVYIEVKGTRRPEICFLWTRNERNVASRIRKNYWIYVFNNVDLLKQSCHGPIRINDPWARLAALGYKVEAMDVYVSRSP